MSKKVIIYVTCKDRKEAEFIAQALIEDRLCACANILGEVTSMFWWKKKIEHQGEVAMILKSREELVRDIVEKIRALHSYECPCVIALPIVDGYEGFLSWIEEETQL